MNKMNIENAFKSEETIVREKIASMCVTGCIENYINYIYSESDNSFENKYIDTLYNRKNKFFKSLIKKDLEDLTVDQLKEKICQMEYEGVYGIVDRDSCELIDWIFGTYTDATMFDTIKKELSDALDELLDTLSKTKRQKSIEAAKSRLESTRKELEKFDERKEDLIRRIKEYENELAELIK